jgi:hypothetical protein
MFVSVSEEPVDSIFTVHLLRKETADLCVTHQTTRYQYPEDHSLSSYRSENLKSRFTWYLDISSEPG